MIKKLFSYVGEYKRASILTPIMMIGEVLMETLIPFVMASLIDQGINAGSMPVILKMGLLLFLCSVASLAFGVLSGRNAATASAGFARNLRKDMFDHVQDFSFGNIDKYSTGGLVTRLTTDVNHVQNAFQMIIRTAVRSPFMLIFSLVAAIVIDAKLSLVFLAFVPVLGVGLYIISSKAHPTFHKTFKKFDRLNAIVQEKNLEKLREIAKENGMVTLWNSCKSLVLKGITSMQELMTLSIE